MLEKNFAKVCIVTGAAGFIGSNLACKLLKQGHTVIAIDNFSKYYDVNLKHARKKMVDDYATSLNINKQHYNFLDLDIKDLNKLSSIFIDYKPGVVCHLAAQAGVRHSLKKPLDYVNNNISGTINLLELCKEYGVNDFVTASTSSVYGLNELIPFTEDLPIILISSFL